MSVVRKSPDIILHSLMKIDSSIRNGQFIYAKREANKLLAELNREEYNIDTCDAKMLYSSLKRTVLFLSPMIKIYAQNQTSLGIIRNVIQCNQK